LNIQFSNVKLADLDGDGLNHLDLVFTSPNGEHESLGPSIFVLVTFVWQESDDADIDEIKYTFYLPDAGEDTSISDIADTMLIFVGSDFFQPDTLYTWYVEVTDGENHQQVRPKTIFEQQYCLSVSV